MALLRCGAYTFFVKYVKSNKKVTKSNKKKAFFQTTIINSHEVSFHISCNTLMCFDTIK